MLPGCYLDATWVLPGRYLDATWVLPGCYLDATWMSSSADTCRCMKDNRTRAQFNEASGAIALLGASNTPVARYGRRVRVHTPWENIKVVCFLSRATSIRKAPPHLGLLPSPHAGYFKKPPPLIQEHAFY